MSYFYSLQLSQVEVDRFQFLRNRNSGSLAQLHICDFLPSSGNSIRMSTFLRLNLFTELCRNIPAKFWESLKCSAAHPKIAVQCNNSRSHSQNLAGMFLHHPVHLMKTPIHISFCEIWNVILGICLHIQSSAARTLMPSPPPSPKPRPGGWGCCRLWWRERECPESSHQHLCCHHHQLHQQYHYHLHHHQLKNTYRVQKLC